MSDKPIKIEDIVHNIADNTEFKQLMQNICKNIPDTNDTDTFKKDNEEYINILNMYFLDENGNNLCDILNKINNNIISLKEKLEYLHRINQL